MMLNLLFKYLSFLSSSLSSSPTRCLLSFLWRFPSNPQGPFRTFFNRLESFKTPKRKKYFPSYARGGDYDQYWKIFFYFGQNFKFLFYLKRISSFFTALYKTVTVVQYPLCSTRNHIRIYQLEMSKGRITLGCCHMTRICMEDLRVYLAVEDETNAIDPMGMICGRFQGEWI